MVDQETSEVYGHVIGSDSLGQTYIIPLVHTIEQIKASFNSSHVRLPMIQTRHATNRPSTDQVMALELDRGAAENPSNDAMASDGHRPRPFRGPTEFARISEAVRELSPLSDDSVLATSPQPAAREPLLANVGKRTHHGSPSGHSSSGLSSHPIYGNSQFSPRHITCRTALSLRIRKLTYLMQRQTKTRRR